MIDGLKLISTESAAAFEAETAAILGCYSSDILVRADDRGVIAYMSTASRTLGWEPEELIGRPAEDLVHPADLARFRSNTIELLRGGQNDRSIDREIRYRCKDGGWAWLEGNPQVARLANGRVEIINVLRDVTERRILRDQQAEQNRFEILAKAVAGVGFWRLDARTRAITWSEQMFHAYGLPLAAEPPLELALAMVHPDDRAEANERVAIAIETGLGWGDVLTRLVRPDGEIRYVEGRGECEFDETGALKSVIGTMVDITDRKRAENALAESEARFRRMAENAPDMITESGVDGILTYVSPASLAITGFKPEELVGRPAASFMNPEDAAMVYHMCQTVFASKGAIAPWAVEFRATHKDGHEIWLEGKPILAVDPVTGRFTGLNDIIRDITQRKTLEAQLRLAHAEAEAASAVKGEFLANMSHEIRTPLTAIIGFTALLSERPNLDDVARGHLQRVRTASRALHALVNDVLDFSKLEAGQFEFAPQTVSPVDFAHETLLMFSPQAADKGLALDFVTEGEPPAWLSFDPDRMRQILLNLIGNAIKFTSQGRVRLRLNYDRGRKRLRLSVEDTGPGMAPDDQAKLFQRFAQIDGSTTRKHGGTGLGLAICNGLVEAMGGQIGVTSQLGQGSEFSFFIVAPQAEAPAAANEPAPVSLEGVRVLVVDDNAANREVARAVLEHVGAEVAVAEGGETALLAAATMPFDVILLDYRMPGMDGPETLRRLRASEGPNSGVPVLGFSADSELAGPGGKGGFDGFVAKPINAAVLVDAVLMWTDWTQGADEEAAHVHGE